MAVWSCVSSSGDEEPHVDLDVEEDQCRKRQQAQQHRPGDVHVVLDVDGVVPKCNQVTM